MELRIYVTEQTYHPNFNLPAQTTVKEFKIEDGNAAEIYFNKQKEIAKKSGGMMDVSIHIATKM